MVMMWSAPATDNILATSLALIGARDLSFLSCLGIRIRIRIRNRNRNRAYLEYGYTGITAVTRSADAILQALIMMRSSMRLSFT